MRPPILFKIAIIIATLAVMFIWVKSVDRFMLFLIDRRPLPDTFEFSLPSVFFGCILAPLWEELAFRHLPSKIATIINPKLLWPVLILSAIVFGLGHNNGSISLLYQGVLGLGFSWVYVTNNNCYWSSVITHALWNLLCFGAAQVHVFVF